MGNKTLSASTHGERRVQQTGCSTLNTWLRCLWRLPPYLAPPWPWLLTLAWAQGLAAGCRGSLAVTSFGRPSLVACRGNPLLHRCPAALPGASFCCVGRLPGTPDSRGTRSTHPHKTPATTIGANFFSGGCVTGADVSQMEVTTQPVVYLSGGREQWVVHGTHTGEDRQY